jgi:AcrR family transcriptional regulator
MNDVAVAAGVTKGCLYHHFASKEALLLALMRERTGKDGGGCCPAELGERLAYTHVGAETLEGVPPVAGDALGRDGVTGNGALGAADTAKPPTRDDTIVLLVRQIWNHFQQPGQLELTTLAINELPKAPEIARVFFDEVVARGRETLRQTLREMPQSGERGSVDDTTTDVAAIIVPYLVMGAALGLRMFHGIDPTALSAEQVEGTLAKILVAGL